MTNHFDKKPTTCASAEPSDGTEYHHLPVLTETFVRYDNKDAHISRQTFAHNSVDKSSGNLSDPTRDRTVICNCCQWGVRVFVGMVAPTQLLGKAISSNLLDLFMRLNDKVGD